MQRDVGFKNSGGLIQIAIDLADGVQKHYLTTYGGIALYVYGNAKSYYVLLRTDEMRGPYQSYRASFEAKAAWQTIELLTCPVFSDRLKLEAGPRILV